MLLPKSQRHTSLSPSFIYLTAPCAGSVIELNQITDPVFSSGMLGDGCALIPDTTTGTTVVIVSPCAATVYALTQTAHAICLHDIYHHEILIHIGIDTVELDGKGFAYHVEQGQKISAGDPLISFDHNFIQSKGYDDIVILTVQNNHAKSLEIIAAPYTQFQKSSKHKNKNGLDSLVPYVQTGDKLLKISLQT